MKKTSTMKYRKKRNIIEIREKKIPINANISCYDASKLQEMCQENA